MKRKLVILAFVFFVGSLGSYDMLHAMEGGDFVEEGGHEGSDPVKEQQEREKEEQQHATAAGEHDQSGSGTNEKKPGDTGTSGSSVSDNTTGGKDGGLNVLPEGQSEPSQKVVDSLRSMTENLQSDFFENFGTSAGDFDASKVRRAYLDYSRKLHPDKFNAETSQSPEKRDMLRKFGVDTTGREVTLADYEQAFKNMIRQYDILSDPKKREAYKIQASTRQSIVSRMKSLQEKLNKANLSDADSAQLKEKIDAVKKALDSAESNIDSQPSQYAMPYDEAERALRDLADSVEEMTDTSFSKYRARRENQVDIARAREEFARQKAHIEEAIYDINNTLRALNDGKIKIVDSKGKQRPLTAEEEKEMRDYLLKNKAEYQDVSETVDRFASQLEVDPRAVKVKDVQNLINRLKRISENAYGKDTNEVYQSLDRSWMTKMIDSLKDFVDYYFKGAGKNQASTSSKASEPSGVSSGDFTSGDFS